MSENSSNTPSQNEEVDLGQLFKAIGNGFRSIFNGIANAFKAVFQAIVFILLHFYKRILWYVGAVVIGLVIGFILNSTTEKSYGANMFIRTNFESGRQVYENMKQLHQLARIDKDTVELAKLLQISASEAAKLKGFYIQSNTDRGTLAEMYSEFREHLDSVSQSEITFDSYVESLDAHEKPVHQIGVASTDKFIYKKIEDAFVEELANNDYLDELTAVNIENLKSEIKTLDNQVQKTDVLIEEYLNIKIAQSQRPESNGTTLYMGDAESSGSTVNEAELLKTQIQLDSIKRNAVQKLVAEREVLSVISGFPPSGYDTTPLIDKYFVKVPLVLFVLTVVVFMLIGLGQFLKAQEEN